MYNLLLPVDYCSGRRGTEYEYETANEIYPNEPLEFLSSVLFQNIPGLAV